MNPPHNIQGVNMDADILNLVQSIVLAVLGFFAAKKGKEKL